MAKLGGGNSPLGVASFAYNPTPMGLGLGLGLASAILGGLFGRRNEKFTPSYKNGKYYVTGDMETQEHEVNTKDYQVAGDKGSYDLTRFGKTQSESAKVKLGIEGRPNNYAFEQYTSARSAVAADPTALSQFEKNFGTVEQNRPMTPSEEARAQFGSYKPPSPPMKFGTNTNLSVGEEAAYKLSGSKSLGVTANTEFGMVAGLADKLGISKPQEEQKPVVEDRSSPKQSGRSRNVLTKGTGTIQTARKTLLGR